MEAGFTDGLVVSYQEKAYSESEQKVLWIKCV